MCLTIQAKKRYILVHNIERLRQQTSFVNESLLRNYMGKWQTNDLSNKPAPNFLPNIPSNSNTSQIFAQAMAYKTKDSNHKPFS